MKKIIIVYLKVFKHLFYDIIPEFYDIKWYKKDYDSKFEYYCLFPLIYIVMFIISLLDIRIAIYRIVYIMGFMNQIVKDFKNDLKELEK